MKLFRVSLTNNEDMRWRWIKTMVVIAMTKEEAKTLASKRQPEGGDIWLKDDVECHEIYLDAACVIAF